MLETVFLGKNRVYSCFLWGGHKPGLQSFSDWSTTNIAVAKTIRTQELKHDPSRYAKNQIG
jgi:hypothetical protein